MKNPTSQAAAAGVTARVVRLVVVQSGQVVTDRRVDGALLRVVQGLDGRVHELGGRDQLALGLDVLADRRDRDLDGLDVDALGLDVGADGPDVDQAGLDVQALSCVKKIGIGKREWRKRCEKIEGWRF